MTPQEILSDEEITRVHANANFGPLSKTVEGRRFIVDEALLKFAAGYHNGSTATAILRDHEFMDYSSGGGVTISRRGGQYLLAVYEKG